jgi:hypothetical protein
MQHYNPLKKGSTLSNYSLSMQSGAAGDRTRDLLNVLQTRFPEK